MSELRDDAYVTLAEACKIVFRDTVKVGTLRVEARRGNLPISKIGRRYFTRLGDVRGLFEKCHVEQGDRGSTLIAKGRRGSSGTATASTARAALKDTVIALKRSSRNT